MQVRDVQDKTMRLNFSGQIIALILFGMIALTLTGSIAAAFLINKKLSDSALDQGRQITATLAHQSILSLLSDMGGNAREDVDATLSYSNVRGITIFDKHGNSLISSGDSNVIAFADYPRNALPFEVLLTRDQKDFWEFTASVYDIDYDYAAPGNSIDDLYMSNPALLGYVSVVVDKTSLYKIQSELLKDSLLIFVGMALVLMLIAIVISRKMTRPLHQLARLMRSAENGQNGLRVTVDGPREIDDIARAFNAMMDALEQRQNYAEEQHRFLLREIDERQMVEYELRESENRLVTIFNNVVDGILILDDVGFIESANPVAASMLDVVGQLVGSHYSHVVKESSSNQSLLIPTDISELLRRCTGGYQIAIQNRNKSMDIDVKFSAMQIDGSNKYIVIIRDITETHQQKNRIELLLAQHEAVVSSVPGIMLELDKNGRILWFNKNAEHVFCHSVDKLIHESIGKFIVDNDGEKIDEGIKSAFNVGRSEIHTELITTDGVVPYQLNMAYMNAASSSEGTLLLIGLDDSQSVMVQRALQKARDVALESVKLKSEFLANMSHEIRTPMNGMFGMLQLISEGDLNEEQHSYAEIALRSADQLLHIINDILDFSKIEAGKLDILYVEISPRSLIEDVVELFSQRSHLKGVTLYSKVSTDVPDIVCGDPARLNQIVSNLISNALKFTDIGHVIVSCSVGRNETGDLKGGYLFIRVEDTGIGIDAGLQQRIFESFVQVDGSSTRRHSGTGLGLAIVEQLVELMGGDVSLRSELRHGSVFTVRLPLIVPDEAHENITVPMVCKNRFACYVGEDPIAASILQDYLQPAGYRLQSIGVDQFRSDDVSSQKYDIYFVDYDQCSSDELILKLSGKLSRIVVMMHREQKSHRFTYPGGMSLCKLVKPIRYHALHACLEDRQMVMAAPISTAEMSAETLKLTTKQKLRLLVVEDNETNLRVIDAMLHKLGYGTMSVRNGQEAVDLVCQQLFDVVLMDCQMPVMDGYQAVAEIRQRVEAGNRTIIIAMTGNAMEGDRQRCLAAGMDDYIPKPIRLTALAEILAKWTESLSI